MIRLKEQKIRQMIAETGYSVRGFSEKYGFSQGSLSNWITGARNIKRINLDRLCDALHCEPQDISNFVFVYTGEAAAALEADRQEICGIFGNLNEQQRKAIIAMAQTVADANRKAEEVEVFGE